MGEHEMTRLSEQDIQKIERINESFTAREEAEAAKEAQQKIRVLFERTAPEALPFVVYVIYMGVMSPIVVLRLLDHEGTTFWVGSILMILVMIVPLFILPRANFGWLKRRGMGKIGTQDQSTPISQETGPSESD